MGSGGGSGGRAVASETRDPQFEPSHWRILKMYLLNVNCIEKTKIKKKRPGRAHFKNRVTLFLL